MFALVRMLMLMLMMLMLMLKLRPTGDPLLLIDTQSKSLAPLLADLAEFALHIARLGEAVARAANGAVCARRVGAGAGQHLRVDGLRADLLPLLFARATGDLLLAANLEHPLGNQLPLLLLDVFLRFLEVLDLRVMSCQHVET